MSPIRMGKIEAKPRAVLAYKEAFNNRDVDSILALLSDDCVFEPAKNSLVLNGKLVIKKYLTDHFADLYDETLIGIDLFQTGIHVIFRWEIDGTGGVSIFKFRENLVSEVHTYTKK